MSVRLILVAESEAARTTYLEALVATGAEVVCVSSISDLHARLTREAFHGVVIDLLTRIHANEAERQLMQEALARIPTLTLRWDDRQKTFRAISSGRLGAGAALDEFIARECLAVGPQRLRAHERKKVHLSALLSNPSQTDAPPERTATIDVSLGGCFVFSADPRWTDNARLTLTLTNLTHTAPIAVQVRRVVPWGLAQQLPGLGLMFDDLPAAQRMELVERFGL